MKIKEKEYKNVGRAGSWVSVNQELRKCTLKQNGGGGPEVGGNRLR